MILVGVPQFMKPLTSPMSEVNKRIERCSKTEKELKESSGSRIGRINNLEEWCILKVVRDYRKEKGE